MRNRELSSEELWTVKRCRTPTVVLTANGEVHTHEEAQVCVHDLNQLATVQLLEETPAVQSFRQVSFEKTTDTALNGSAVKSHD